MDRRQFNSICSGLLVGAAAMQTHASTQTPYQKTKLLFDDEQPVNLDKLEVNQAYIFSYPFVTTPCFLVRLPTSAETNGGWPKGIGSDQSVVAFSAICSHKMSHPAKPISHISYRAQPVDFYTKGGQRETRQGVISCCSERSVYDPTTGASVLSGPAPSPLAAILLDLDNNNNVSAYGSYGPDQYERFLTKFGFRLAMEYGITDVRARTGEFAKIIKAEDFSAQQVLC